MRERSAPVGRAGEVFRLIALASVSTLLSLALVEGAIRLLDLGPTFHVVFRNSIQRSDDPELRYELRPGAPDGRLRINSIGLRDDEPTPRGPGVVRIAAIGDSVTFGSGVPRRAGWTDQLEALLAVRMSGSGSRAEVWNLGVPGYNAAQVVARLRLTGMQLEPDVVVYGYVLNDPQAYSLEEAALDRMQAEAAARAGAPPADAGAVTALLSRSRLFLWVRHLLVSSASERRKAPEEMPDDPAYAASTVGETEAFLRSLHDTPASWSLVESAFDELAALGAAREIPVLVVVFPIFPVEPGDDPLADVRTRVVDAAVARGFGAVDLTPAYLDAVATTPSLEVDFLHPNRAGHRVAAQAIASALCEASFLRQAPAACKDVSPD